ncbi:Site-specific recombinase XerD [Chryseobacterium taklimakanense]|uniref:Site-specific recombinase XerD n=1 Tax=Chryseobacterium taklimakanense TaxID=536441 RepID=A0A239X510_9FLAO|nr:phage integrase SAM-like domain-containing protein [Chryseobacterium taklimakanense]SNV41500.1 Site-specific recombinase XerD [Chryseobacterium taklimakanense]
MASVSFSQRATSKDKNKLNSIYVRFREKDFDAQIKIPNLACKSSDWKDGKCKNSALKMFPTDEETINTQLSKLEAKILEAFAKEQPETNANEWLKSVIQPDNNIQPADDNITDNVIEYFAGYVERKEKIVTKNTLKANSFCKSVLERYQNHLLENRKSFKKLKFKDLSNTFRLNFEKYCKNQHYRLTTVNKITRTLKSVAKDAQSKGIEIHPHILEWVNLSSKDKSKPKDPYLSFDELKIIAAKEMPNNYLDNARDWLIIACFTGQRVSDYLNFKDDMITTTDDGKRYIEFKQQKTGKQMRIPILKEVEAVLEKNDGKFPRSLSDVNFNLFIKQVCKIAGLDENIKGSLSTKIGEDEKGDSIYRDVIGTYPKWQLVTSHIGRKSFATNFYSKIPIGTLMFCTGHKTQQQLLEYISKTDNEQAESTAEIFAKLDY